ncbi:MAG: hypothetical protein OEU57_16195, partial [Desulfuromonadales bacterium]|nr:hypothetical protein [Desulfuromonadales bacterium]
INRQRSEQNGLSGLSCQATGWRHCGHLISGHIEKLRKNKLPRRRKSRQPQADNKADKETGFQLKLESCSTLSFRQGFSPGR